MKYKLLIQNNYDKQATNYSNNSYLQHQNLINLLSFHKESGYKRNIGNVLDAGCGNANNFQTLKSILNLSKNNYYAIDLSHEMLKQCKYKKLKLINGDLEQLPFKDAVFSTAISNSVLHWLNSPKRGITPTRTLNEIKRVLKTGGILLLSVSGQGTCRYFLEIYSKIMKKHEDQAYFNQDYFINDPIGSMTKEELSMLLNDVGFKTINIINLYEPIKFNLPEDYIRTVESYGYDMFMLPIVGCYMKRFIWNEIKDYFVRILEGSNYSHDQYMLYCVAIKS